MQKNNIIKQAEYLNIVNTLIEKYGLDSLFKVEITALVLYYQSKSLELHKSKYNILKGFFESLHFVLLSEYKDFNFISEAIYINQISGRITVDNDKIIKNCVLDFEKNSYLSKDNINEIICTINLMSMKSFAQEVISNV